MGLKPDNEYAINPGIWKNVKMGAPPVFDTKEALWAKAQEYFEYCDNTPIKVKDWVGKDAIQVDRPKPTPYSLAGFCVFAGASRNWFKELRKAKKEKGDHDFLAVCSLIEDICFNQQYNGATTGIYNHNIVSRALGLSEQTEQKITGAVPVVWNEEKTYEADKKADPGT
jgi:hypothetical protein